MRHDRNRTLTRKMKVGSAVLTAFILFASKSFCQEISPVFTDWNYFSNPGESLYKHLADEAFSLLNERKSRVAALKSKDDWLKRQREVNDLFDEILGGFPEKQPLNAVVTGILKRDDVVVEKVYYESLPGYYVTGALFLPVERSGPLPAIVYCSGHSPLGFRSNAYQHVILNYVKKGFAVFAFDPIGQGERKQYATNPQRKTFGPTHEHSYPGSQSFLVGRPPAYYFIWDGIRAIDYLCSRPEIDSTRIGVTGRSGGGTQTAYIAAFDDRVKASAPECYITSYEKLLMSRGPQDAEQNFANSISSGLEITDLLLLSAPKPLKIISTTRDIFSIQGARDVFDEMARAYEALGARSKLSMAEDDDGHASTVHNREATYQFFQDYLDNPGEGLDEEVAVFSEEDLHVTAEGNLYRSLGGHTLHSLTTSELNRLIENRKPTGQKDDLSNHIINSTGFVKPESPVEVLFSGKYALPGYDLEKYLVKGPTAYYLPIFRLVPPQPKQRETILLLDEQGKQQSVTKGGLADSLALAGYEVVLPDLSGYGELGSGYFKRGDAIIDSVPLNLWYMGLLIGKPLLGVRMQEISTMLNWIGDKPVIGIASGALTTDLLHTAYVDNERFQQLVLVNPLISFQSLVEAENYQVNYMLSATGDMLSHYDLPYLVEACAAKQQVVLINPRDGAGNTKELGDQGYLVWKNDALNMQSGSPLPTMLIKLFNENKKTSLRPISATGKRFSLTAWMKTSPASARTSFSLLNRLVTM